MGSEATHDEVFLRKSSGLVRSAGPMDVFIFNFGLISVGIAVTLAHTWVPTNYPGASLPLAEILAGVFMGSIAWVFWCWSAVIPRSGGIYAFVSRGVSPGLGFALSFVDTFVWLFYNALAATFLVTIGIGPGLFAIGAVIDSPSLVQAAISLQSPGWQFVVGGAAIILAGGVLAIGMRAFFKFQKVLLVIALTGTVVLIIVLARSTSADFLSAFNAVMAKFGVSSASVLRDSPTSPWTFSWKTTLLAAVWPVLSYVGSVFSVNIGGEVRNSLKAQAIGMFGSIAIAAIVMATLSWLGDSVFTREFQASIGVFQQGKQAGVIPLPVNYSFLAALTSGNAGLALAICLGFFAWAFFWIPATLVYAARAVIAWSFDRMAPAALGFVHEQRHTPVTAIFAVVIVNIVFLALFVFTPFFNTLVLVLAAMLAWIPTMAGAIFFPYRRPEMFAKSGLAKSRLLGVPTMTIAGSLGLVSVLVLSVLLWNDDVAAGHSAKSLGTIAVLFSVGLVWYGVARFIRKRQGMELDRAFKEIPIE